MPRLLPRVIALFTLVAALASGQATAQIALESHASVCEAVRPANGHYLVHLREGLENQSNRTTWVNCPTTAELVTFKSDHLFSTIAYNISNSSIKMTCIFRYLDLSTGFRNISRTRTIPAGGTELFTWELFSREVAMANINCKLPPGGALANITALTGFF